MDSFKMEDINDYFFNYLLENGYKDRRVTSINQYLNTITEYLLWVKDEKNFFVDNTLLNREKVISFLNHLSRSGLGLKTMQKNFFALEKFNEFLIESEQLQELVVIKEDLDKIVEFIPLVVEEHVKEEKELGIEDVKNLVEDFLENAIHRNYVLIQLLAYTGVRLGEAIELTKDNLHLDKNELIVNKDGRVVFFDDFTKEVLREYLNSETEVVSELVFPTSQGKKVKRPYIHQLFINYSKKNNLHITPNDLREVFYNHALNNGVSQLEVANQLGITNVKPTIIHTNEYKDNIIQKLNKLFI